MARSKEVMALLRIAEEQGCTWDTTGKGHYRVRAADRRVIALTAGTPSDRRGLKNFRADLRRGGVTGI